MPSSARRPGDDTNRYRTVSTWSVPVCPVATRSSPSRLRTASAAP